VKHFSQLRGWCGVAKLSALILISFVVAWAFLGASDVPRSDAPSPVLVELFTSEGCSDCPPADALLQKLDRTQPVAGEQLIVLSEHVDYWNRIGWTDPYSSSFFSDRQTSYSDRFGLKSVYTPQMVVDGSSEFVGNNPALASQALQKARAQQKIPVRISGIALEGSRILRAHVEADALPEAFKIRKADVCLAVALNYAESQVLRGENSGRRLTHVGVVQHLNTVGSVETGKNFSQDLTVKLDPKTDLSNLRVIAFVQQTGRRQVLGAAMERVK
jgi:hypothetical protein